MKRMSPAICADSVNGISGRSEVVVERAGFAALYEQHYPRIFNYVMRAVMNVAVAEDIVSETFFNALNGLRGFKGGPDRFQAWVYRIATNALMDHFRRRAKEPRLERNAVTFEGLSESGLLAEGTASEGLERFERYQALHRALSRLDDIYRISVVLFYFEEKSVKEVARILDCSLVTTRWRLYHARRQLGAILAKERKHESVFSTG